MWAAPDVFSLQHQGFWKLGLKVSKPSKGGRKEGLEISLPMSPAAASMTFLTVSAFAGSSKMADAFFAAACAVARSNVGAGAADII